MNALQRMPALRARFRRWRSSLWALPPNPGSHESLRKHEQDAANEAWEHEGGSVRPPSRSRK
ncbi:MAG TPA: hypothetical protein VG873_16070 [Burkholderiales bacterium]|nr:hypothetical protein [Burkholderiales bacterium]